MYASLILVLVALLLGGWIISRRGLISVSTAGFALLITPVLTPMIVQTWLGFEYFSANATQLQTPPILFDAHMLALTGIAAFTLSCCLSRHNQTRRGTRIQLSTGWILIFSMVAIVASYLMETGPSMLTTVYSQILEERNNYLASFFGIIWVILASWLVLAGCQSLYFRHYRSDHITAIIVLLALTISILYLLLHARRGETAGVMLLIGIIGFGIWNLKRRLKLILLLVIGLVSIVAIGYIRGGSSWEELVARPYFHLPGGPGNPYIGFVACVWLIGHNILSFQYGGTLLSYIINLPPKFLVDSPAARTYDLIHAHIPLNGGTYFFSEPYLNFGIPGIILFGAALGWLCARSDNILMAFAHNRRRGVTGRELFAAAFTVTLFKTCWYSYQPLVTVAITMAVIILGFLALKAGTRRVSRFAY